MGIHVLNKGKAGEREAIKFLQPIIDNVCELAGVEPIQLFRNQNQSALGGYDIDGLPWLALEIKRQENLLLNKWWAQVTKACADNQVPVVMFRQNRKQWRFLTMGWIHTGGSGYVNARVEMTKEDFINWFEQRLLHYIEETRND